MGVQLTLLPKFILESASKCSAILPALSPPTCTQAAVEGGKRKATGSIMFLFFESNGCSREEWLAVGVLPYIRRTGPGTSRVGVEGCSAMKTWMGCQNQKRLPRLICRAALRHFIICKPQDAKINWQGKSGSLD